MTVSRRALLAGGAGIALGAPLLSASRASADVAPPDGYALRVAYEKIKTPYKHGMVLPPPGGGHYDSPSVFAHGGRWWMVVVWYDDGRQGYETRLAVSDDLLGWQVVGTILPFRQGWDAAQAAGYVGLQDPVLGGSNGLGTRDGRYWLSYIGGSTYGYEEGPLSIGVASTTDPTTTGAWDRRDAPVLAPTDAGARWFERNKLYKSTIIEDADRRLGAPYVMYYNATGDSAAGNSGSEFIGAAVSDDLVTWRRYGSDPVVSPGGTYANRVAGDPQVIKVGDLWVMSYWSRESAKLGTGVFNSFAGSYDLARWTPWAGEKLLTTTVPYERSSAHKPWILHHDGVTYQFYSAVGDEGFGIAVATSRDLRANAGAVVAGASYTYLGDSPGEAVDGVVSPTPVPENRWTAWDSPNRSDWLVVEYPSPRTFTGATLEVYDDGNGVRPPRSYTVEWWTGSAWIGTSGQVHSPAAPAAGRNTVTFDAVTTDKMRVFFDHADPANGVFAGVTELTFTG